MPSSRTYGLSRASARSSAQTTCGALTFQHQGQPCLTELNLIHTLISAAVTLPLLQVVGTSGSPACQRTNCGCARPWWSQTKRLKTYGGQRPTVVEDLRWSTTYGGRRPTGQACLLHNGIAAEHECAGRNNNRMQRAQQSGTCAIAEQSLPHAAINQEPGQTRRPDA